MSRLLPLLALLALGACGGASAERVEVAAPEPSAPEVVAPERAAPDAPRTEAPIVGATSLFPERPELDAIAPSRRYLFKQESWTQLSEGSAQHCHEWAFPAEDEPAVRDEANAVLARLGITQRLSGIVREAGLALSLGVVGSDALYPVESLVKLVACTEGSASGELLGAFVERLRREARGLTRSRALSWPELEADVAWERRYADGRRQIGLRLPRVDAYGVRGALLAEGFVADGADFVRGRERVRFVGTQVWWQAPAP